MISGMIPIDDKESCNKNYGAVHLVTTTFGQQQNWWAKKIERYITVINGDGQYA